jgi:alkaline phosphatase
MTMSHRSVAWLAVLLALIAGCARVPEKRAAPSSAARNVVFFVGDGFGIGAWSVGRAYAKAAGQEVVLDRAEHVGLLETRCEDALVTDSAAAATAWATGRPGRFEVVGLEGAPNLFERLAKEKRAHGFLTTTRVTHATPAPFFARVEDREQEAAVAEQLVANFPTIVAGGGRLEFLPASAGGRRKDGRDLLAELEAKGVEVLARADQPLPAGRKVFLLLADSHMDHEIDRKEQPDLAELVVLALRRLRGEPPGWFLLVEEGLIDHAAHSQDAPTLARDVVRLDRAVAAALKEADLGTTTLIVTGDHATGNPNLHERARPESLDVVSMSVERMSRRIFEGKAWRGTPAALEAKSLPVLAEGARHTGLRPVDLDRLLTAKDEYERRVALGIAISRRFGISFLAWEDRIDSPATDGHTGDLVPAFAWGARAAEIVAVRDHAALGRWIAALLGLPETAPPRAADSAAAR